MEGRRIAVRREGVAPYVRWTLEGCFLDDRKDDWMRAAGGYPRDLNPLEVSVPGCSRRKYINKMIRSEQSSLDSSLF